MSIDVTKDSIDIGIVVRDAEAALKFYRDTLGFEHAGDMATATGTIHRLMCGTTVVKVVSPDTVPEQANLPGGPGGASGIATGRSRCRTWTC